MGKLCWVSKFYDMDIKLEKKEKGDDILVSVVIPTYNREKIIKRAIESILNQSYKNIEIIVVDDGSTDNTKKIIEELNQEIGKNKIKYIYKENRGVSVARNVGALNAKGKYISFLDSDDKYLKNKIERHLYKTVKNNADFSICNEIQIRNGFSIYKKEKEEDIFLDINNFIKKFPSHSTSLFFIKRDIFLKYLFDKNQLVSEDTEFILRYLKKDKILFIKDVLVERYKDLIEKRLSFDKEKNIKAIERLIFKIIKGDYGIKEKRRDYFLFRLYFKLGAFNILNKKKKEGQKYFLIAKNIRNISFFKKTKTFFIFLLLYLPFFEYLIIYFGKILWKFGIIEGK